jgi:hypothetical protein
MSSHVDGNALAGPFSEVFRTDMTTAVCCCGGCGDTTTLATEMVYGTDALAHGSVVRCRSCDDVLITLVETPDRVVVRFPGIATLSVDRESPLP